MSEPNAGDVNERLERAWRESVLARLHAMELSSNTLRAQIRALITEIEQHTTGRKP